MTTYMDEIARIVDKPVSIKRKKTLAGSTFYSIDALKEAIQPCVAHFNLQQLPGCCGICVSFYAYVFDEYRKRGLGNLLNKMRQQIAWDSLYTILLCTDVEKNTPQQKILTKNGWEKLLTFKNRNTDNMVCLHTIELKDTGMKIDADNVDLHVTK